MSKREEDITEELDVTDLQVPGPSEFEEGHGYAIDDEPDLDQTDDLDATIEIPKPVFPDPEIAACIGAR